MSAPNPPREYLAAGTIVGERYEIRRRLGSGGIGDVYKAVDTRLSNRTVAVKMLSTTLVAGPLGEEVRARFMLEAQALSAIRDDHVVSVLNFGLTDGGVPYLVMEYLEGQDLASLLKTSGGILPVRRAVDVALDICGGVYICHNEEIVHRDLKPANIFLERTPRGERAKVVDFGISKTTASAKLSRPGVAMGTPRFMAPEQRERGHTDKRSDQYSIGLILYGCLTGQLPDKGGGGPHPKELRPEVPELLDASVMRALARDPEARFPSVYAFGRSLMPMASEHASARWREYYRTPPQPRSSERSEPMPASFVRPDGRFDPSTIRVSYDAATRMGSAEEVPTNRGAMGATEVDVLPLGGHDGVPQAIPVAGGGTVVDFRREIPGPIVSTPAPIARMASSLGVEAPVQGRPHDDGPAPATTPGSRRPAAAVVALGLAFAAAGAVVVMVRTGRLPVAQYLRPHEAAVHRPPSAPEPPPAAANRAPASPPVQQNAPLPAAVPILHASVVESPPAHREHHHARRNALESESGPAAAPDGGVRVRYTGDRDPILE